MQISFVLGIHRSGTSLLAAGLQAAGAHLGTFDNKRNHDNQKGEFEHGAIVAFNDRLLAHLGASWDNWALHLPSQGDDLPDLATWEDEATRLLETQFGGLGAAAVAVKDPRITTLLPFWSRAVARLGWRPRHVMVIRPPAEVAASQRARAEYHPDRAFPVIADDASMCALWALHSHAALLGLPDDPLLLVRHDALYAAPARVIDAVADHLELSPNPDWVRAYLDSHVTPALRRARARPAAAPPPGGWEDLAHRFHAALAPAGHVGRLTGLQARAIARRQVDLERHLPLLPALRRSLGRARGLLDRPDPAQQLRDAAIWTLGQALIAPAGPELQALDDRLAQDEATALNGFLRDVLRARLAERLGQDDRAATLYGGLGRDHPDRALAQRIERAFRARRAGPDPQMGGG